MGNQDQNQDDRCPDGGYEFTYEAHTALGVELKHDVVVARSATHAFKQATKRLMLMKHACLLERFKITRVHRLDLDEQIRKMKERGGGDDDRAGDA